MLFSVETIADHLEEAKPLIFKHWRELEYDQFPLDPDFDLYIKLEQAGSVKVFAARNDQGVLIGYAVYNLRYHPHYKTVLVAACDLVFIDAQSRGHGLKFIEWCDVQLKSLGVKVVIHHLKITHRSSRFLERIGYKTDEIKLTKRF